MACSTERANYSLLQTAEELRGKIPAVFFSCLRTRSARLTKCSLGPSPDVITKKIKIIIITRVKGISLIIVAAVFVQQYLHQIRRTRFCKRRDGTAVKGEVAHIFYHRHKIIILFCYVCDLLLSSICRHSTQ